LQKRRDAIVISQGNPCYFVTHQNALGLNSIGGFGPDCGGEY